MVFWLDFCFQVDTNLNPHARNPRARSAHLRVGERTDAPVWSEGEVA